MARNNRYKGNSPKPGGSRFASLVIVVVILLAVGGYFIFRSEKSPPQTPPPPAKLSVPVPLTLPRIPVANNYSAPVKYPDQPDNTATPPPVPADSKATDQTPTGYGRLAIIIDDMGSSMQEARSLAGIGVPLTFSIIPGLRSDRDVAAFAASRNLETMIHIPMQSKGWPARRLESNGLLLGMDDAAIRERLEEYLSALPGAVGANNHMGSEFTENEDKMRTVLNALKGRGLYFVDSVTSPRTVGLRLARELDMKSGRRNVFLDNEQNDAYIRGQLDQAVRLAKKTGGAIAICHPHPVTIHTLEAALPGLAKQGVALVPASQLMK